MAEEKNKNNTLAWLDDLAKTFRSGVRIKHKVPTAVAGKTASDVVGHLSSKNYFYMHPNQIYGTYDRMVRYCLAGDMLVLTDNGPTTMLDVVRLYESGSHISVYSCDKSGNFVWSPISNAWKTKQDEIIDVKLSNGSVIRCTKDHPFMLDDGGYLEAQHLDDSKILKALSSDSVSVSELSFSGVKDDVYDITVPEHHNFAVVCPGTEDLIFVSNSDFQMMESTPEIAVALDVYASEATSADENGRVLKISSNDVRIKKILESLFSDVICIDYNIYPWVRNLVKFGDLFVFLDIHPSHGVTNVLPIPVDQIEREEGYDPNDPFAVRFNWVGANNRKLENHQVLHFRLSGNDSFLPYGSSILDPARKIWRTLSLLEDAVMIYRLVRSPERRVFKIDVGNIPPEHVDAYIEKVKNKMKQQIVTNEQTGRVDLRYSALTVSDDYFLPVRGGAIGSDIESLPGGSYTGDIQDVEYIQSKLFMALKMPKSYFGGAEGEVSANALVQMDVKFGKIIQRIQSVVESELKKLAMIHLFAFGYRGQELTQFDLKLAASSMLAVQQKQEIWRNRLELMGNLPDYIPQRWAMKTIMGFDDEELEELFKDKIKQAEEQLVLDKIAEGSDGESSGGDGGFGGGSFGGGGGGSDFGLGDIGGLDDSGEDIGGDFDLGDLDGGDDLGTDDVAIEDDSGSEVEDLFAGEENIFARSQFGPFGKDGSVIMKDKDKLARMNRRKRQQAVKSAITYGVLAKRGDIEDGNTDNSREPIQRTGDSGRKNKPGQGRKISRGSSRRIGSADSSTGKRHISVATGHMNPAVKRTKDELISDSSFKRDLRTSPDMSFQIASLLNGLENAISVKQRMHETDENYVQATEDEINELYNPFELKKEVIQSKDIINDTNEENIDATNSISESQEDLFNSGDE